MKQCRNCQQIKPFSDFSKNKRGVGGVNAYCRPCALEINFWYDIGRKYGCTKKQYLSLLSKQDGVCAICQQECEKGRLCVDHCHNTGAVRGLLCRNCNLGLGNFKGDPDNLKEALNYLCQHQQQETPEEDQKSLRSVL